MQFVTHPVTGMSFAVALGTTITNAGQVRQHLCQAHLLLPLQPRLRFVGGLPFFRRGFFGLVVASAFFSFLAAFSRALIAVASREIWPTKRGFSYFSIIVACTRSGNWLALNSANAREKVASLGKLSCRSQPHKRRNVSSLANRSSNCRVVSRL